MHRRIPSRGVLRVPEADARGCNGGGGGVVPRNTGAGMVRSRHWIKSKNPRHPAVKREAEEDWE
jgi:hypothetical protein